MVPSKKISNKRMLVVLAVIMSMVIIAPVVAPILGSLLLKIASWRAIFLALSGFGLIALLIVIPLEEPLAHRYQGSTIHAIGRLFVVLKNPGFSLLLCIFSVVPMSLMAMRAPSANLMLEQHQHDTGSAASLINFFGMMMGSIGMLLISVATEHLILTIGMMQAAVGLFGYIFWRSFKNHRYIIQSQ